MICYLDSGAAVTHRIIAVTDGEDGLPRYITKGDANDAEDHLSVAADQIQGIWKGGRISGLGNALLFMQTTTGMLLFIVLPLLLFLSGILESDIIRIKRRLSAEQNWRRNCRR